jgi:hypothetical protein
MRYAGLVVHGAGEEQKGDMIKNVVSPIYEFLAKSNLKAKPRLTATPENAPGPARATIDFEVRSQLHQLEFREVWWARSFDPPPLGRTGLFFVEWGLRELWQLVGRIARFLADFVRRPGQAIRRTAGLLRRAANFVWLQMMLVDVLMLASAPLWLPLLLALWVLNAGPIKRFVPPVIRKAHKMIVNIIVNWLGDLSVYLEDVWEAARIRSVFEDELEELVKAYKNKEADELFIIAYSLGAVVTFEGLLRKRELVDSDGDKPYLQLITVGSGLNRAWRMRKLPGVYRDRFRGDLPKRIRGWTDIWASHDPVPMGAIEEPDWAPENVDLEEVEVLNQEDLFADHGAYWNNGEEVIARLLKDIAGITPDPEPKVKYRRFRVHLLALCKAAAWASAPAVFLWLAVSEWSKKFAEWIEGTAVLETPLTWFTAGGSDNPNSFVEVFGGDWLLQHGILPFLAAAFLAIAVALFYSTVIKWLWDSWDRSVKYR